MGLQIEATGSEVKFSGSPSSRVAADYLSRQQRDDWEHLVCRALEVGRTSTSQDMEFMRHQVDGLLHDVTSAIGSIAQQGENGLVAKVGTGNGQVLAPIVKALDESVRTAERGLEEARKLLHQVDSSRSDGAIGRARQYVKDLLDPKRKDSVSSRVEDVIKGLGERGGSFAAVHRKDAPDLSVPFGSYIALSAVIAANSDHSIHNWYLSQLR